jgi:hypothetical protein
MTVWRHMLADGRCRTRLTGVDEESEWLEFWEPEIAALCDIMASTDDDGDVIEWLKGNVKPKVCLGSSCRR